MEGAGFPIDELLPALVDSLSRHPRLVLEAPPGAGKTTRVAPALLGTPWLGGRRVVMLEPRRVAARAAAAFMAQRFGEPVGASVGYRIRFESKVTAATRIEIVTEGILTRMIQDDPTLEGVGAILFDEFHERHLAADLGLALALDVQAQLRPDLRLVVMSATLDGEPLAAFLDAPRLVSQGRAFPVSVVHFPARRSEAWQAQLRRCLEQALATHGGDLLVFLPGLREIAAAQKLLGATLAGDDAPELLTLHGELAVEEQARVLQPAGDGRRRIVLATNVAESSVTLPGVRVVVDLGLAREPRFDPNSGFSRLQTVAISRASADQRAGRAGRVAEGWCYRLWPESQRLEPARRAEIQQVELAGLALELAAWGASGLRMLEPPPAGALAAARDLLQRLGALEGEAITAFGRRLLTLGTHPRLAAMLLASADGIEQALACDLAALVEARDPLRDGRRDDWASRWRALAAYRTQGRGSHGRERHADPSTPERMASIPPVSRAALAAVDQAAKQWRRRLRLERAPPAEVPAHLLGDLLLHAFPDRIAHQHPNDPRRYQLANGRSARLFDDSALYGEPWLVASELRFEEVDSLILRAAPLDEARLAREFPKRFIEEDRVQWDADRRAIVATRERRFDRIVLETRPLARPDPTRLPDALIEAVRQLGLDALPWSDELRQWRERVRCLRTWRPELGLPDLSDETLLASLEHWLKPALVGKSRLDALGEAELAEALKSGIDRGLRQRVDQLAPTRARVPSGMQRRIEYRHGEVPVLAVKLQELFGLVDTPRIDDGRVALTLHLLSPAGRPLQVTQDLRGFWERTYPEVKKEMKGRYPRHPWPDDPWSAPATHRVKPRAR